MMDKDIEAFMNHTDSALDPNGQVPPFNKEGTYLGIMEKLGRQRTRKIRYYWAAAAVFLLLINVGFWVATQVDFHDPILREISAPKGKKVVVLMTDGSRVWLNGGSKLIYPEKFSRKRRSVSLEGEGYFEIQREPSKPFQVTAGEMAIEVLGTSFNVSAYPEDSVVTTVLDEGSIRIGREQEQPDERSLMAVGDVAVYHKQSGIYTIHSDRFHRDASSWKEDRMIFRNTDLPMLLKQLEREFGVTFHVSDETVLKYTYTFEYKGRDISAILDIITSITPVSVVKVSPDSYLVTAK